jgi:hypothetical protein
MSMLPLTAETLEPASSRGEAEARADVIRAGLTNLAEQLADLTEIIGRAYHNRDWLALGYASWETYTASEFGTDRLRLPRPQRQEVVASLRAELLSTRAIAGVLGVGVGTVHRDSSGVPNGTPIAGIDGKSYSASRPAPPETEPEILDAEIVDDEEPTPQEPWSEDEQILAKRLQRGETIVVTMRGEHDRLIRWAVECDAFVRIDRRTDWGNPFEMPADGDRATVIESYKLYLERKYGLHGRFGELRNKALGCWCAPDLCHGDVLKARAEQC